MKNKVIALFLLLLFLLNNHNKWVMYTTLKIPVNGQELHISVKIRSLYNVVFTVLNYHSSSDQVHPRNNYTKSIGYHKL